MVRRPARPDAPAITGAVTAATGGGAGLGGVVVDVFDRNRNLVDRASTRANGTYTVPGVTPSRAYYVCFDARKATGGISTTGYASQCYRDVAWSVGAKPPRATTPVPVPAAATASGINASLVTGGSISGRVTAAAGGVGLKGVTVDLFGRGARRVGRVTTTSTGTYSFRGVAPSAVGYRVCVDTTKRTGVRSKERYLSECYKDVRWSKGSLPPAGVTAVPVSSAATVFGVDVGVLSAPPVSVPAASGRGAAAAADGAISGVVAAGGAGLDNVLVEVFDAGGSFVRSGTTAAGSYTITGLAPSVTGYRVCFDASDATGGTSTTGYASQCYHNVAFSFPPPSTATAVPVAAGATVSGINAALTADGGITGTVTAATGGGGLGDVTVDVFDSGGSFVTSTPTASDGSYKVIGLEPSVTGYGVCFDAGDATGGSSTTGYASQCYNNVGFSFPPPATATEVPVSAGATVSGISAALTADGGIAGTVTAATGGGGLENASVEVFDSSGDVVTRTSTAADGTYKVIGLEPSVTGYRVCFDASEATGGSSTTGYASQCYHNVAFSFPPPATATAVPVSSGATASGINAALISDGGIAGTVTAATGGGGLGDVTVDVFDSAGSLVMSSSTASDGSYKVIGLEPSVTGYRVCFDASDATGGSSTTGYASQCYHNVAFSFPPPASATAVPVATGATVPGINAALTADGGIAGTVTAAVGGGALANVSVEEFDSSGDLVTTTTTAADGTYKVIGLAPSVTGYRVCFDASDASGGSSTTGYASQCHHNVAFSFPPPASATAVPVSAGATASGINAALTADGGIAGTVTAAVGGGALGDVSVQVFDSGGGFVRSSSTASNGSYKVIGLAPSVAGYRVCFDAGDATGGSSTTGYASRCYKTAAWARGSAPPAGATAVPVAAGATASGISVALTADGGLAGTVTAATGGARLAGVTLDVFDSSGDLITTGSTAANGTYKIISLTPTATGYRVCFDADGVTGGSSTTGYASQCHKNVPWSGFSAPPASATPVPVAAGAVVSGINAALTADGGIAGTVTATVGGAPVADVSVQVFDSGGGFVTSSSTALNGSYKIIGLAPSAGGYTVCFDASDATGGSSTTGYASQCYKNVAWARGTAPPAGATPVPVAAGALASGINAALTAEGAVSGTVTAATGGAGLAGVTVDVFDSGGDFVTAGTTASDGTYKVIGLPPSAAGYSVCFDAREAAGGSSTTGYASQCYDNVPWAESFAPAAGSTAVPVAAGATASGINAALAADGGIAGTVTAAGGGAGVSRVTVTVFDSGEDFVTSSTTASDGTYKVIGLAPSATGYTVCFDATNATGGSSTTGYASQCYHGVAWSGSFVPPPGTTPVPVSPATIASAIDAALTAAGGIAGTVTAATGGAGLVGVSVDVFDSSGNVVTTAATASGGTYKIIGLTPSATGYKVCFDAATATVRSSDAGYLDQCYQNVVWSVGTLPPPSATAVPVSSGVAAPGIDAALVSGGGISGTVTALTGGAGLEGVMPEVVDAGGLVVAHGTTAANGSYAIRGLPPSAVGYTVCFYAGGATGGKSPTGYASQCFKNVPWDGADVLETGTTPVPVTTGAFSTANAVLVSAAGISGKVTAAVGGAGLGSVNVDVFDGSGNMVAQVPTNIDGRYAVSDLALSTTGYTACFDAAKATGGSSTTGYASQCYKKVTWPGIFVPPPRGTAPIAVANGVPDVINVALSPGGNLAGTVTAAAGGALQNVAVEVYTGSGTLLAFDSTGVDGTYAVKGLPPSTAGYTVCFDAFAATGGASSTGYTSQCNSNARWGGGDAPPPSGTTVVPLAGGATATVNAVLAVGSAVSGTVSDASTSNGVGGVVVRAYDNTGHFLTSSTTEANGSYKLTGLAATAAGDAVCFDPTNNLDGLYAGQCWKNVAWLPVVAAWSNGSPATGSTAVPLTAGATATGVDAALSAQTHQGIGGKVTAAVGGAGIGDVVVQAFDSAGTAVGSDTTASDGTYRIELVQSATGYTVCFDGTAGTGASAGGYQGQCYNNLAWSPGQPTPAGAKAVPVTTGVFGSVNAALKVGGAIRGTVTTAAGGKAVAGVAVAVFNSARSQVAHGVTDSKGSYDIESLPPSAFGYAVCFDPTAAATGSNGGYVAQCYKNVAWARTGVPAPGSTAVPVSAGAAASRVDAALSSAGAIAGGVTSASSGAGIGNVSVDVFDSNGNLLKSAATLSDGTYALAGLAPSTHDTVCFDPTRAFGGGSPTGYAPQCETNVPWVTNRPPPTGARSVTVSAGATTHGVNAQLTAPGAIAGTVTTTSGRLRNVLVKVSDSIGNHVEVITGAAGTYTVSGLPASATGYTVCFDGSGASVGSGVAGYSRQCYKNVAWNGQSSPSRTTAVPVKAGATTAINARLVRAASIAGTVTAATRGGRLVNVNVVVFDSSAHVVGAAITAPDGTYRVTGLAASATGYRVCFDASFATGGASRTGYVSRCYRTAVWNTNRPPPAGTTAVRVKAGAAVTRINAALATAGSIAGKVAATTGGGGLRDVSVVVFDKKRALVALSSTASNGAYAVVGLPPATGYIVCFDASQATGVGFAAHASKCYKNVAWTGKGLPAAGSTAVRVSAGATTRGINASVATAAAAAVAVPPALTTQPDTGTRVSRASSGEERRRAATLPAAASAAGCDPDDLPTGSEGPDADGDECTFTVKGGHPFVVGGPGTDLAGQSTTDPSSSSQCSETKKVMYSLELTFVLSLLETRGATNAVTFLLHWADGSGTDMILPDGSNLSNIARGDSSFQKFDKQIQAEAKRQWNGGTQDAVVKTNTVDWGGLLVNADLFYSFGGTQGLDVDGSATNTNGAYVGNITYTITDTYGWNNLPTFTKSGNGVGDNFRPAMHYLQTYCGSTPTHKNGPHWFKSGVVVKVPIQ